MRKALEAETMSEKKSFEVIGKFKEKGLEKKFKKVVNAPNEAQAAERVMQLFGSKNKVKRRNIIVDGVKEVKEGA